MSVMHQPTRPEPARTWFAVDFDGQSPRVIAGSLFAIQAALFLVGRVVDLTTGTEVAYGFFVTMLLFASLAFLDARSVRIPTKQAAFWAAAVMFGLIVGGISYARRRQYLRRSSGR